MSEEKKIEHQRRFSLQFNRQDDEIFEWFRSQPNKGAYLKTLILNDKALREKDNEPLDVITRQDRLNRTWEEKFALVKEFIDEFGRLPFHDEKYKGVNLGRWLSSTASRAKEDRPDRALVLESIGAFDKWERCYQTTIKFIETHGRLPLFNETYLDICIGLWVSRQRTSLRKGSGDFSLTTEQKEKLNKINIYESLWETNYQVVLKFQKEYDRLPKWNESYFGIKIGRWLSEQRANLGSCKNAERTQKIASLGTLSPQWEESFVFLKKFKEEFQRLPKEDEVYLDFPIGRWLTRQCRQDVLEKHPEYIEPLQVIGALPYHKEIENADN